MILSGRWVVPVSSPPLKHGAIVVEGSRILEVGSHEAIVRSYPGHKMKSFPEAALLPGLVNVHTHLELTVLRGYLEGLDFWQWIRTLTRTKYEVLNHDDILVSALLGSMEAVRAGITTVADPMDIGASLDAVLATGLRAVLYQEVFSPKAAEAGPVLQSLKDKMALLESRLSRWPEGTRLQAKAQNGAEDLALRRHRVTLGISPHALFTVSAPLFQKAASFAREHKYPVCIHAAESEAETELVKNGSGPIMDSFRSRGIEWSPPVTTPIGYLQSLGVLNRGTLLVHCIHMQPSDYEILQKQGVCVAHCPKSNVRLQHGFMNLASMRSHQILTGLGTDSVASNNSIDVFEEMRFASANPCWMAGQQRLSSQEALRMATLGGAEALGMSNSIGSLEREKQADIIAVDLSQPHNLPVFSPIDALVLSARASDVVFNMVAGEVLFEDDSGRGVLELPLRQSIQQVLGKLENARSTV
jgi:cytosine/adenosine deaminase-related metal-dependent hydrolase